jgi:FKBP-type peptidyl-prolyl cis-trans isomerase FkpA
VGGKAKLVCPSDIAYADHGQPPRIPGGATLVFEVELLGVTAGPPPGAPGAPGAMPGRFPTMTVDAGSSMSFKPKGCGCGAPGLSAWGAAAVAGLLARRRRRAGAKTSNRKDALMRTLLLTALAALVALPAFAADEFKNEEEKSFYAIGYNIGQNMASNFAPSKAELEILKRGLADGANSAKPEVTVEEESPKWAAFQQKRRAGIIEDQKAKGAAYLAKAAKEKGAKKLESGLVYLEEKAGSGEHPKPTDKVKVNYRGTLINGLEFDSSYSRGQPAEFPLGGVVKCWTEGLQKMKVGGKAKLVCPAEIAYADRGQPPRIPGGATLVFEVELLGITAGTPPNMPGPGPMTMPPHPPIPPPQTPPAPKQ